MALDIFLRDITLSRAQVVALDKALSKAHASDNLADIKVKYYGEADGDKLHEKFDRLLGA